MYDFIQEWLVILARKEEVYENTKTILKSHQDIHSLASMIVYQEEYSEGLKVILEYLNANVDKLSDGIVGKIDDNFDKFHDNVEKFTTLFTNRWRYVNIQEPIKKKVVIYR